jgi:hypothetical protein
MIFTQTGGGAWCHAPLLTKGRGWISWAVLNQITKELIIKPLILSGHYLTTASAMHLI